MVFSLTDSTVDAHTNHIETLKHWLNKQTLSKFPKRQSHGSHRSHGNGK